LIHTEANSTSYFLGLEGTSDHRNFIEAESKKNPFQSGSIRASSVARFFQELALATN
jgi:hypothetical protein